jgi:SnoaL-like domain
MATADDYEAVRALIHEYCYRIDAGDLDGVAALFEHAELGASTHPHRMRGIAEARQNYAGVIIYEDGTPHTMHCISNVTIWFDEQARTATSRSYFTVMQSTAESELRPIIGGQYRDRFECIDGNWRFTERIIHPDRVGDLSLHMHPRWTPPRT